MLTESIVGGRWLTDAAGQKLLKQAHPRMGGLQPTILGLSLAFEVQISEFVQVLHIGGNHWLTVSITFDVQMQLFIFLTHYQTSTCHLVQRLKLQLRCAIINIRYSWSFNLHNYNMDRVIVAYLH